MSEACDFAAFEGHSFGELDPPMPHERRNIDRSETAILIDRLLTRSARGRGALDVAIGDGLAALAVGIRPVLVGFSRIGDYAPERLGIAASTAQKMVRLAQQLRERPLLRSVVWSGEVSARKAQVVVSLARGQDEAVWVERSRVETVRSLRAAVRAVSGGEPLEEDEPWERIGFAISPEVREVVGEAFALAGKLIGPAAPKWQKLEALCEEFLGAHPLPPESGGDDVAHRPIEPWVEELAEWLEQETQQWAFLDKLDAVAAAPALSSEDPFDLDEELRRLAALRRRSDETFGRAAWLFRSLGLWRDARFASFAHYCAERLGMSVRAVEQRIALERRLQVLPALRREMREGRISYEKARLVAWQADDTNVDEWIGRAETMMYMELRRAVEAAQEAQMCARGELELRVPQRTVGLVTAAIRAARAAAGAWISAEECLRRVAQHFIDTWGHAVRKRNTPEREVLARNGGFCQVPGCSRAAVHSHHLVFRSHGGGDEPENRVGLCAVHHLQGVHRGYVRVWGKAPDELWWQLGVRPGRPPLIEVKPRGQKS